MLIHIGTVTRQPICDVRMAVAAVSESAPKYVLYATDATEHGIIAIK